MTDQENRIDKILRDIERTLDACSAKCDALHEGIKRLRGTCGELRIEMTELRDEVREGPARSMQFEASRRARRPRSDDDAPRREH
jgi:hypothetical protein